MSEDPLDITSLVKVFNMSISTSFPVEKRDGYIHSFSFETPPPVTSITLSTNDIEKFLIDLPKDRPSIIKMTYRGRFWFDTRYNADVIMKDIKLEEDGSVTATYISTHITDLTNRSWLARFLRWVLRRK